MIRSTLQTDKGPIGIIGISFENLRRLKAGMPLDIDIKPITPPGTRMNRVIIHYAHTYEDVVKDMEEGFDIDPPMLEQMYKEAKELDREAKRARRG